MNASRFRIFDRLRVEYAAPILALCPIAFDGAVKRD